jgi:hypothetical protein
VMISLALILASIDWVPWNGILLDQIVRFSVGTKTVLKLDPLTFGIREPESFARLLLNTTNCKEDKYRGQSLEYFCGQDHPVRD